MVYNQVSSKNRLYMLILNLRWREVKWTGGCLSNGVGKGVVEYVEKCLFAEIKKVNSVKIATLSLERGIIFAV